MLVALFLFQSEDGTLLYDIIFQEMDDTKLDLFSGFISAIKIFISGMKFDSSKELKTIDLDEYKVIIERISEINIDITFICVKQDEKLISKIVGPITEIILENNKLFKEKEVMEEDFQLFDDKIKDFILSNKKLIDESLIEESKIVFKSIWSQKGKLSAKLRDDLTIAKNTLKERLEKTTSMTDKLILIDKMIEIAKELDQIEDVKEFEKQGNVIRKEINDLKLKLKYYLEETKNAVKNKDYKKIYLNLLNFSLKLKEVAKRKIINKYQMLANIIMNKENVSNIEFSRAMSEISIMPDNIDEYLF